MKTLVCIAVVVLLAGCNPCRRAQGHIARAALLCPEAVQLRTDKVRIDVPGDTLSGTGPYPTADVDTVLAGCEALEAALLIEQERYRLSLGAASRVVLRTKARADSLERALQARQVALNTMRKELCVFPSILDSTAERRLRIWYTPAGVRYTLNIYPRQLEKQVLTPTVVAGNVITVRQTPWWMWVWAVSATLLGGYWYLRSDHFKYHLDRLRER